MAARRSSNTFFKIGLPMIGFMIVGSVSLSVFMQHHYDVKDRRNGSITERKFDLKKEHDNMMQSLDISNFSLSRIPRPEEDEKAGAAPEQLQPLDLMEKLAQMEEKAEREKEEKMRRK